MRKLFTAIALFMCQFLFTGCNEFGSKSEYATLQEVEYSNRLTIISKVEIITKQGHIFAGFRTENGRSNTWVLLNPKFSPYYKQIPQVNFKISHEDIKMIRNIEGVSDTVITVLETRIVAKEK